MIICRKILEKEIENRVSKSFIIYNYVYNILGVKEQRVNSSRQVGSACLRCTLMGTERYYQVKRGKIRYASAYFCLQLSNQINKYISFSTLSSSASQLKKGIDPNFITGFTDAEGCFTISVIRNSKFKTMKSIY